MFRPHKIHETNVLSFNYIQNWVVKHTNFFLNFVLYFLRETRSTAPEAYAIFLVLPQNTTVQYTDILKQSLNIVDLTFIVNYFIQFTWQGITHYVKFLNRDHNNEHNYNCAHLYLYILYRWPSRWRSDIETCCNIKIKHTSLVLTAFHFPC